MHVQFANRYCTERGIYEHKSCLINLGRLYLAFCQKKEITVFVDKGKALHAIYITSSKFFNTIFEDILVTKLGHYQSKRKDN